MNTRIRLVPLAAVALGVCLGTSGYAATLPQSLGALRDLGRANGATRVDIGLVLNYRNEDQLDRLVEAQGDDASPLYHHFLNQQQFQNYFSPTPADYARVEASLQRAGFTITQTFANRTVIDASAPAPVAERYFNTEIHRVQQPGVGVQYANVRPATIPADIDALTTGVVGLSTIRTMHPDYRFLPAGSARPAFAQVVKNAAPIFGPDGGYGPQIYIGAYDLPAGTGTTGTGRATGVAGDADFLDSDLAGYLSYFQVNRTGPATVRVAVDGGPKPGNGSPDSVETALDVETVVSLAPGTALYVYETKPFSNLEYFIDLYNKVVSDNLVDTLNTSYSQCETAFEPKFPAMANKIEKQGSAEGITFHASAGDDGNFTYGCSNKISVGTPTDTPYNISVGGTILPVNSQGQITGETAWNDSSGATGGGVSVVFKLPSWQKKVTNIITSGRNIPDVAFDASPYTGESFYYEGGFEGPIGGTSLSSPIFGASLTEIDQLHNARAGYLSKALYKAWLKHGYGSQSAPYFRDITQGEDSPYKAQVGYDQMTGIGAVIATNASGIFP